MTTAFDTGCSNEVKLSNYAPLLGRKIKPIQYNTNKL